MSIAGLAGRMQNRTFENPWLEIMVVSGINRLRLSLMYLESTLLDLAKIVG